MTVRPLTQTIEYPGLKAHVSYRDRTLTLEDLSKSMITITFDGIGELVAILTSIGHQVPESLTSTKPARPR